MGEGDTEARNVRQERRQDDEEREMRKGSDRKGGERRGREQECGLKEGQSAEATGDKEPGAARRHKILATNGT